MPSGPCHRGRRHHRAEADHRADGQIDAAGKHHDGLRRRDHCGREPALDEFRRRADRENARKQDRIEDGEQREDKEQSAEAVVAAPLDAPIEPRALAAHQAASPGSGALRHAHGGGDDRLLGRLAVRQRSGDPTLVEHHHAIAEMDEFGRVGAEQDDGLAFRRHLLKRDIDLALGLDVDAASGVVQQKDGWLKRKPLGHRDLLLVAAGQGLRRPSPIALDVQAPGQTLGDCRFLHPAATLGAVAREERQEQVEINRMREEQALLTAIRGNVGDAEGVGVGDFREGRSPRLAAVREHAELVGIGGDGAVEAHHEVLLPVPDEAADPEDLAATQLEIDVMRRRCAESPRPQDEIGRRMGDIGRKQVLRVAADHQAHEALGIEARERTIGGDRAILQDGHVVAEVEDLVEPV